MNRKGFCWLLLVISSQISLTQYDQRLKGLQGVWSSAFYSKQKRTFSTGERGEFVWHTRHTDGYGGCCRADMWQVLHLLLGRSYVPVRPQMADLPPVNSPRRVPSLSRQRRDTNSFLDVEDKASGIGYFVQRGPKLAEVYGFVGSITTVVATVTFLIWAYLPEKWLHAIGIFYYLSGFDASLKYRDYLDISREKEKWD